MVISEFLALRATLIELHETRISLDLAVALDVFRYAKILPSPTLLPSQVITVDEDWEIPVTAFEDRGSSVSSSLPVPEVTEGPSAVTTETVAHTPPAVDVTDLSQPEEIGYASGMYKYELPLSLIRKQV
ncbi:hypothetical protein YC2023_025089 [Brassica napus]